MLNTATSIADSEHATERGKIFMKATRAVIGRSVIVLLLGLTWWMPSHPAAVASAETETLSAQVQTPDYRITCLLYTSDAAESDLV